MKTLISPLTVNRLLSSLFTLSILFYAGSVVASTTNETNLTIGEPATKNTTITSGIEYASLAASATEKSVFINWVTSSEQNNSHFEVERSTDMNSFKTVAMVLDGFVAEGTGKSYKFKEDAGDVRKGKTIYYRLKQIDTNSQVHYSAVMAVQMNTTVTVFPAAEASKIISTGNNTYISVITSQILLSKQSNINAGL